MTPKRGVFKRDHLTDAVLSKLHGDLKAMREEIGITQQQAADKFGVTRSVIAYYEGARGGKTSTPPVDYIVWLADQSGRCMNSILSRRCPERHVCPECGCAMINKRGNTR